MLVALSYPLVTLLLSVITAMKYWPHGGHHRQVLLYCEMEESGRGTIMYSLKTTHRSAANTIEINPSKVPPLSVLQVLCYVQCPDNFAPQLGSLTAWVVLLVLQARVVVVMEDWEHDV